jgi:probable phosphoglycerate mutase
MKDIYVIVHTESIHHVEGKVGGWFDTGLTDRGRAQARATAARLADLLDSEPAAITSSDLLRAKETAEAIAAQLECPLKLTPDLRELSYGIAEGQPQSWLDERFEVAPDYNRLDHRSVEGAETKREFLTRIYHAVDDVVSTEPSTQIIVTHGYALTFAVARWIGMPPESAGLVNFRASAGGITHLQEDDFLRNRAVRFLNSTSHLSSV